MFCSFLILENKIIYNENKMKGSRIKWSLEGGISGAYSISNQRIPLKLFFSLGLLYVFIFNILALFSRKQGNAI